MQTIYLSQYSHITRGYNYTSHDGHGDTIRKINNGTEQIDKGGQEKHGRPLSGGGGHQVGGDRPTQHARNGGYRVGNRERGTGMTQRDVDVIAEMSGGVRRAQTHRHADEDHGEKQIVDDAKYRQEQRRPDKSYRRHQPTHVQHAPVLAEKQIVRDVAAGDAEHRVENVRDRRQTDAVGVGAEIPGQVRREPLHYYVVAPVHRKVRGVYRPQRPAQEKQGPTERTTGAGRSLDGVQRYGVLDVAEGTFRVKCGPDQYPSETQRTE